MDITLEQAIKGFQLYNEAAGRSRSTYSWYDQNLIQFQKWLEIQLNHKPYLDEITADLIRNYLGEMRSLVETQNNQTEQQPKTRIRSLRKNALYGVTSAWLALNRLPM